MHIQCMPNTWTNLYDWICKSLVSTGDRSAKIRTYNFPQGRVTDHRIGYTTHDLQGFLGGDIQAMIDALTVAENAERMKETEL